MALTSVEYDQYIQGTHDSATFLDKAGREHYRLLGYISTLYMDRDIFDIGTHTGCSAFALAFNETNRIHSFDLCKKVSDPKILSRSNISFNICNLLDAEERTPWLVRLVNSPIIFLDIDPHNGILEYQFYEFLRDQNYQGLLFCDDIHYFQNMRNNFWSRIPDDHKCDITGYGHWSGTGIISFNQQHKKFGVSIPTI